MRILRSPMCAVAVLAGLLLVTAPGFSTEDHTNRDYETALAKGSFALETGDFPAAITLYKDALTARSGDKAATLGLTTAYSRTGNFLEARRLLLQALASDPSDARLRYELGVVSNKLGDPGAAKESFTAVIEGRADDTLKAAARKYLELLSGKAPEATKGLSIGLAGGLQYDSNVILEPDNPPAALPSGKADWRAVFSLDSRYRFLKTEKTTADAGYQFYQSIHRELHDFNIQQHSLKLSAAHALSNKASAGVKYAFSYSLAGGSHFSDLHEIVPYVAVSFTPESLTEFHVLFDKARYVNGDLFPLNADQSGTDQAGGFLHTLRLGASSSVNIGYDYDVSDANEGSWSYQGSKGRVGLQSKFGQYTAVVSASYYDRKYRDLLAGYTDERHDGVQEYSLDLSRNIGKDLDLSLSGLSTISDSNLPAYAYRRTIFGLFAVTRL